MLPVIVKERDGSPDRLSLPEASAGYVVVIDERTLTRECLVHAFRSYQTTLQALSFPSLQAWRLRDGAIASETVRAVLFHVGTDRMDVASGLIAEVVAAFPDTAVVVLSQDRDFASILEVMQLGARGYIPTSVDIRVCYQAIRLAISGGQFIPASSLLALRESLEPLRSRHVTEDRHFTARQSAVAEALRCGKPNKSIASELHLSESTVKVHIRNIMRKLEATNRTEVAFKIGDLFGRRTCA